jgi:hypothetical protein
MSKLWRRAAGWPEEGTFHSLRHYFATILIAPGWDATDIQKALRHSGLRITLETYVHWWLKKERRRNVVSTALRAVAQEATERQDQSLLCRRTVVADLVSAFPLVRLRRCGAEGI